MRTLLKIPKAAVSMQEGTLTAWLEGDGDCVVEGQPIYTLEIEKSTMDVEAPAAGTLRHIGVAGVTYKVGEPIGEIESVPAVVEAADIVIAPGAIYHTGYVVGDIHTAVRHWVELAGAGPFALFENFRFVNPMYRGTAAAIEMTIGFGYSGDSCIELIQTHTPGPNIYSEGQGSLHHVGIAVADLDTALHRYASVGVQCLFRAGFPFGGGCAYLDTTNTLGIFTELVEVGPVAGAMLKQIRSAHQHWNRRDYTFTLS